MTDGKLLSIIVPTYKSESNLTALSERIDAVLRPLPYDYELIIVNDCSPDDTMSVLREICARNSRVKVLSLSRNFGQQIATTAGLQHARGDAIVIMDDDLQDPPESIPILLEKWEQGYEVVYGIRRTRQENWVKRTGYKLVYQVLSRMSQTELPRDSGDFGLIDRKVVSILNQMPERNRFLRGMRAWVGYRQVGVEIDRAARNEGRPAYNMVRMVKLFADGLLAFSNLPLRISSLVGFIVSGAAFVGFAFTFFEWALTFVLPDSPIAVWPGFSTIVLSILFLGGVQLIGIGILGEYIARIYNEVKQRPLYLVNERIGFEGSDEPSGAGSSADRHLTRA